MTLHQLQKQIVACKKCPRLVRWREKVALQKVKRFTQCSYWGKPVPGFGDPNAELLIVGLAPAAHGGNRTGRMFTGDQSGDWLFRALYKAHFANQATSISLNDSLQLSNCYITAACRCAPPKNKPLTSEIFRCRIYLLEEFQLLKNVRVIIGLGKIGFDAVLHTIGLLHRTKFKGIPHFGHGVEYQFNKQLILLGSFHPSQQNTFTGRLTEPMFDSIFRRTHRLLENT
jgi:uracil-DNA glycosylase